MSEELEQIQTVMRTNPPAYWADKGMQDRYQQLISESSDDEPEPFGTDLQLTGVGEAQAGLVSTGPACAQLADEWSEHHAFPEYLRNTQNAVMEIVSEFSSREQRAFMARFDQLPEKAIASVYRELSMGKPNYIAEASEQAVASFSLTPEGAELVREWGYSAPRRVGIVKARFARAVADMGSSAPAFWSWFNGLDSHQAKAILRQVAR